MFCANGMPLAPPTNGSFDCSTTSAAQECFKKIARDSPPAGACGCLASSCRAASALLEGQSSQCILGCRDLPSYANICPDYDDSQDWCSFYASWRCVRAEEPSCDKTKVTPSTCEAKCEQKASGSSAEDRLDSFLQCLGGCSEATAGEA